MRHLSHETEDGPEIDYWVFEEVPPKVPSPPAEAHDFPFMSEPLQASHRDFDERPPTLKSDVPSLTVHHVCGIKFQTEAHSVHRYRSEKRHQRFWNTVSGHHITPRCSKNPNDNERAAC